MPSTHLSLHYHFVFSTKDRFPFIVEPWRADLHRFLGACLKTSGCVPQEIGGVADHVHLAVGLRATHCVADVLMDIKKASSRWVHTTIGVPKFRWQEGYGAFTISESNLPRVRSYVAGQAAHHKRRTFEDEYRELLTKHRIRRAIPLVSTVPQRCRRFGGILTRWRRGPAEPIALPRADFGDGCRRPGWTRDAHAFAGGLGA